MSTFTSVAIVAAVTANASVATKTANATCAADTCFSAVATGCSNCNADQGTQEGKEKEGRVPCV